MNDFQHVLVPVDFEPPSLRALAYGADLAQTFDAALTIVHAWNISLYEYAGPLYFSPELWSDLEMAAKLQLDDTVSRVRDRVPKAHGLLLRGTPSIAVLDAIRATKADLVVMGTHGRGAVAHFLLGSIAEKVVRTSPVPVLIVRAPEMRG